MTEPNIKRLWKKDSFQTIVMIATIIVVVFTLWFGTQFALGTQYPALAVASGSMCTTQHMTCDGYSHPFEHTLHVGDLIIVQGVDPKAISAAYPDSDIIVFHKPRNPEELIVHRVVAKEDINGTFYFRTKGDGNGRNRWPETPDSSEYDDWLIPQDLVVGRVVMRIPWIGHVALFLRNSSGMYVIIAFIILLVVIELALPLLRGKKPEAKPEESAKGDSEPKDL